ncbi:hypothetical protein B4U37_01965 [Sutcliffiella horikoshii]|uniref:DUF4231 domain-containing protein n=1 Tax=Sutcliffiella horikoshii TaxID=79883 RepID=A0ABN4ZDV3_9BACI|nr:DUF4231 domain-containing protein [Sutcliffiella horikoshii]ART74886.1 hypothetical protein B4U37_01965 [Sutcliffiella horikoshii]
MTEQEYLIERLEDQISWYDKKSGQAQRYYKWMKRLVIIISASIPLFVGFIAEAKVWATIVGTLGVIIAGIEGWLSLSKYHENWIEYRSICETLKHEKYMFLTKTGVYNGIEDPFKYFVERVESIISKENVNWANLNSKNNGG